MVDGANRDLTATRAIAHQVLLVEDDVDTADFVKELLEKSRYRVTIVKDGGQAHASFVMHKPDFVILDLILPGESGFEICERMKHHDKTVPIMVLSAIEMEEAKQREISGVRRRLTDAIESISEGFVLWDSDDRQSGQRQRLYELR